MKRNLKSKSMRYIKTLPLNIKLPKTNREKVIKLQLIEDDNDYFNEDTIINDSDEPKAEVVHIMCPHKTKQFFHPTIPIIQEYIPHKYEEIGDNDTYFHCIECLQVLIGVNKYINKYASYIKITNSRTFNSNNRDTKPSKLYNLVTKKKNEGNQILKCANCNHMLGIEIDSMKYLLKNTIVIKSAKTFNIGLFGIKLNLLDIISKQILSLCDNDPLIKINSFHQTKDALFNFDSEKCLAYKNINVMFIVHKIEGRVLLLGKNGFYNLLIKEMRKYVHRHIYFILIINSYSMFDQEEFTQTSHDLNTDKNTLLLQRIIEDLAYKGKQEELIDYYVSGGIILLNEMDMSDELGKYKLPLIKELKNKISILPEDINKRYLENNQIESEDDISNMLLEEIKKEESTIHFGESCKIL